MTPVYYSTGVDNVNTDCSTPVSPMLDGINVGRVVMIYCLILRNFLKLLRTAISERWFICINVYASLDRSHNYLGFTLLACRTVAQPHIELEICTKSISSE